MARDILRDVSMKLLSTFFLLASLFSGTVFAAVPVEPSIIITHTEDKTFYEYTLNGEVLEIKVVPKVGPSYYLVPTGDNSQEFKRATQTSLVIPKWVIFSW
ncbi:MAG: DUF2782 domain-containing protein [Bermanella sp.]